jgi:aspartate aminotransferase-like enzyme
LPKKPAVVFAPHVETASGIILPDDYLRAVANAVHAVGGLFVLDCVASGAIWVDMKACGIDVLISAPQKGWSASPCCALIMMSTAARERVEATTSTSFAADLKKWLHIMHAYESGGHMYHATMPTDALAAFRDAMQETVALGLDTLKARQRELGTQVRTLMARNGLRSVAATGFEAPGVVVCYTDDDHIHNGRKFIERGLQTAAGVPLMCDEPADYKTFRVGLFGLDKLQNIPHTVGNLDKALAAITAPTTASATTTAT